MPTSVLNFLQIDFGTKASAFAVLVFLTTLPFCIRRRQWPDTTAVTAMVLRAVGAISGVKIIILAIALPFPQLGALNTDQPALMLGGLVTLVVSSQEASASWRKIAGI